MAYVPIPKDLNKVKTKVALNLTRRQIIGFSFAGLIGLPTYLGIREVAPNDIAIVIMALVTLPVFFVTMYEKDGLTFEKYFRYIILHKMYQPAKRVRKEVYLEEQKKPAAESSGKTGKGFQKRKKGNERIKENKKQ